MKRIALYDSLERATDDQNMLISLGIQASVQHMLPYMVGGHPSYSLSVIEDKEEQAIAILRPEPVESYFTIIRCPFCGSRDVKEQRFDSGFGAEGPSVLYTFMIPVVYRWIQKIKKGTLWHCYECENQYRTKP